LRKKDCRLHGRTSGFFSSFFNGPGSRNLQSFPRGTATKSMPLQISRHWFFHAFGLGLLLLWASASLSGQKVFTGPMDYVVGAQPNSIVVADFNGDGLSDFATANVYVNTVTVVLQNPDGTFQPYVSYAVGNYPASLQVGDVDNDGKPDLVVVNLSDNTMSVLLGNGDGTFQAQIVTTIIGPITGATCCLALADFNGDGKLDVAAPVPVPTQVGTYGVAILLGNGNGTFQAPVIYPTNTESSAIVAADFNHDGKPDIAAGNSILLGNGDGTFQALISEPLPSGPLVIADFNQDGNLDIATSGITILYGNGDGTFQVQPLSFPGTPLAAGDLNGDGKPDLIATGVNSGSGIDSLLNEGTSMFTIAQTLDTGYSAVSLSDLKSGQPLDLLIAKSSGGELSFESPGIVTILSGNGDGTFPTFPSYPASQGAVFGTTAAADFNGDGKPDLAIGEILGNGHGPFTYKVELLLNNGAGFGQATSIQLQVDGTDPVAADFNGDGKMDLAVGGAGVAILLGNGDGTFQPEVDYGSGMTGPVAVADFNNDGRIDVLGIGRVGDLAVILGNGDGSFGLPLNSPVGNNSQAIAMAVADFNQDGKLDVAALVVSGYPSQWQFEILLGKGDGTFSIGAGYSLETNTATIASGDLNGDGIPDIVIGAPDNSIEVFLGNGDGTFQSPITTVTGNGIYSIVFADFDLDGKQDVAFTNANWSDVTLLLGNGDGTFKTPLQFSGLGAQFTDKNNALSVADFDGNGSPDIAEENSGGVFLLLSAGMHGSAALVSPPVLAFGGVSVGQTSAVQTVILTNTNSAALSITGLSVTGSQSGDFTQTNSCGTSLSAGATCMVNIVFTPQAAGTYAAVIRIMDSAFNSPQIINLSGTGVAAPDFTFGVAPGGSSSSTISAGGTATFGLAITPTGLFSGTVSLTCNVTPVVTPAPICSIPNSVSLSGASSTAVTVKVTTTAAVSAGGRPFADLPTSLWFTGWALALSASGLMLLGRKRRLVYAPMFVLALVVTGGCGGNSSPTSTIKGTPAGKYTVTATATSGSLSHQAALTVIVQ
jgi:hypothetical protein